MVMFGTKWPSITSICIKSAPAASTALISSPSLVKSADKIEGDIELRLSKKGDKYTPIGKDKPQEIEQNVPILEDRSKIISIVGVRDSIDTMVTENSKNLLLVSWGASEIDEIEVESILERCAELIKSK